MHCFPSLAGFTSLTGAQNHIRASRKQSHAGYDYNQHHYRAGDIDFRKKSERSGQRLFKLSDASIHAYYDILRDLKVVDFMVVCCQVGPEKWLCQPG